MVVDGSNQIVYTRPPRPPTPIDTAMEVRAVLNGLLAERTKTNTSAHWIAALNKAGVPCGPINSIDMTFADVAIAVPQVRDALITQGLQPETTTPAAFSRYLSAEITKWRDVARKANLKPE